MFVTHVFTLGGLAASLFQAAPAPKAKAHVEARARAEAVWHLEEPLVAGFAQTRAFDGQWHSEWLETWEGHGRLYSTKGPWGRLPQARTPEDSAYRQAREVLNRGEYRRAAQLLAAFAEKYPRSRHVQAATYYRAFALYRVGTDAELRQALGLLDQQRQQHPDVAEDPEVTALTTRVIGALAVRGDADAANRVRQRAAQGVTTCDREDMEVRAEALAALVQSDPSGAAAVLRRTLARRDECSAPLRRRAVYLLGREGVGGTPADMMEAARNDPDPSVRADALSRLAQMPGDEPVRMLDQLLVGGSEERVQRTALQALRRSEHPDAARIIRRAIERDDLSENVRAEAIRSLARRNVLVVEPLTVTGAPRAVSVNTRREPTLAAEDVTTLRALYERSTSRAIKSAVLETISSAGGPAGEQWLASLVRNQNEELRYRTAALGRLRRSEVSLEELNRLYDALTERELRLELIRIFGSREEPAATDKLIEIARTGTEPNLRRAAISALSRKNDPRTQRLLLELIER